MSTQEELEQQREAVIASAREFGNEPTSRKQAALADTLTQLDALESPLPSEGELIAWPGGHWPGASRFMARVLRWRIANPEVDLESAVVALESRGGL